MSLLKRFFARPSGDTRVLTGPGGPLTLVGREGDAYFERASLKRLSESTLSGLLDRGVRGAGAALDVGANIGLTTVLIARHGEGAVYAFEPHPPTFACLGKTIAANGLANAHAVNLALGREEGELPFFVDSDSSASHVVSPQAGGRTGSIIVPISTVDAFAATIDGPVTFMKIDAEGAEPDVLAGAAETLARDRPSVFIEFNLFTLMALSNINPRRMLEELCGTFPYVYRFAQGTHWPIASEADIVNYLHEMLTTHRITTDLYCSYGPL